MCLFVVKGLGLYPLVGHVLGWRVSGVPCWVRACAGDDKRGSAPPRGFISLLQEGGSVSIGQTFGQTKRDVLL